MRLTFRLKTILGVAAIEALLLSLLVASGVHFIGSSAEAEFERRSQATVKAFSVMAKDALIASDLAALKALTREMLTYPGVVYAQVHDGEQRLLVGASTSGGEGDASQGVPASEAPRLADVTDGVLRTGREIRVGEQLFGRVEVGVSAGEVQSLKATAKRYGLALGALEMALVALFSWLLGAYLTRQLARLALASRHIADGELGYQMPVRGSDELADTAQAFNRMSLRLVDSYADMRRNEQNLRRVLETIQDGILTLDAERRILSASPAAQRLLQRGADDLIGRALADCFALGNAAALDALLGDQPAPSAGSDEPPVLEAWLPDGGLRPLEVRASSIEGAGQASRLVVLRDVTERLLAERALRLRGHIIDTIGVGIIVADARAPDQPVVYVNAAFERITGWPAEQVLGRNCRFLQGPQTEAAELVRLRRGIAEQRDIEVLLVNYTRDGRPFWNELRVMPVRDPAGTVTHFVALQNDVSARIESAQAIARSEEELRRVLNATHDGIIVIDESGTVLSFNAGAERLFGWRAGELLGRNVSTIVPEPHQALHDGYLRRYLASGESHILGEEREFEARRQDGTPIWIALRVGQLDVGRDAPRRFIGVVHDITQRKHAELELRQAKEAAEDAAIAKSEFLASMSHEIRTPMHGVLGSIEMLEDTALTGQQQRYLETARTSAGMLLGVIDEILDFSRLEAGKLRIELLDFDLRRTVEDVTAMLAQRAHGKKLELACYIAPEVPELLRGDPIRLRQVLVNLVGNAIKFTERGEVVVSVSAVPAPPAPPAQAA
ncbi:MAG TPA: PAS domain S-box protein, partial [Burkholderiaceae bacterium]|nr:PAS domain S-box protein [Burkholderiaceae bacterium]